MAKQTDPERYMYNQKDTPEQRLYRRNMQEFIAWRERELRTRTTSPHPDPATWLGMAFWTTPRVAIPELPSVPPEELAGAAALLEEKGFTQIADVLRSAQAKASQPGAT